MDFAAFTYNPKTRVNVLITPVELIIDENINPDYKKENKSYTAIWDTGATNTVISKELAEKLNLTPNGIAVCNTAGGRIEAKKYLISLKLLNGVEIENIHVTEGIITGSDFLIGMDVITLGDFAISNVEGQTTFTFRIPSCKRVDFVDESNAIRLKILENEMKKKEKELIRIGNQLCGCGSGKKLRYCHGKLQIKELRDSIEEIKKQGHK